MGIEIPQNVQTPEKIEELNNRQEQMLIYLNQVTKSDFPLTIEGYNEAGRSNGIINRLSTDAGERERLKQKFLLISREK